MVAAARAGEPVAAQPNCPPPIPADAGRIRLGCPARRPAREVRPPMNLPQVTFLVILVAALALFIRGRMRVDLVAMLVLLALAITGVLDLRQAMSGFGSEPAIIVAAVFVLSAGLVGHRHHRPHRRGRSAGPQAAASGAPSPWSCRPRSRCWRRSRTT